MHRDGRRHKHAETTGGLNNPLMKTFSHLLMPTNSLEPYSSYSNGCLGSR